MATKDAVFTLPGAEGTVGAYVNSHGFIHQTLTLRTLLREREPGRIYLEGRPEGKDSWFAGYAWQIAYCGGCGLHLGWKFSTLDEAAGAETEASQDRPHGFWGLRRAALVDELPGQALGEEIDLEDWMLAMVATAGSGVEDDDEEDVEEEHEGASSDTGSESSEEDEAAG